LPTGVDLACYFSVFLKGRVVLTVCQRECCFSFRVGGLF